MRALSLTPNPSGAQSGTDPYERGHARRSSILDRFKRSCLHRRSFCASFAHIWFRRSSAIALGFWWIFLLLGLLLHAGLWRLNPLILTVRRDHWDPGRQKLVVISPCFESCAQGCQFQGFKVWDPGVFWVLGFGGTAALEVQVGNPNMFRALPKLNLRFLCLLDLGKFKFLFKNKHDQICSFRLWFYFLFSWGLLELDWFYWSQWQYLPEFFCWLFAVMHGVCIVLGFKSSIRVLDSSIRSLLWSVMLLLRMPLLRIVILYY